MIKRWLIITLFLLVFPWRTGSEDGGHLVNAVIGNASYHDRFGSGALQASESLRIRTHLEYVIDILASTDESSLSPTMREARRTNVDRLRSYVREGAFPQKPSGFCGRTPNFVDDDGNVCAVGYLVEQDLGRDAVFEIAAGHQLNYVPYIASEVLARWQSTSGLSTLELAMIQPTYGDDPGYPRESDDSHDSHDELVVFGLVFAGIATSFVNSLSIVAGEGSFVSGAIGVGVGAASLVYNGSRNERSIALDAVGMFSTMLGGISFAIRIDSSSDKPKQLTFGAYATSRYPAVAEVSLGF